MKVLLNNRKAGMEYVVVFDLDGTLSNDSWREGIALQARACKAPEAADKLWADYHGGCLSDTPHQLVVGLYHHFHRAGAEIWVVTARPEKMHKETLAWLQHNVGFMPNLLAMRPEGNKDRARDLKSGFLASMIMEQCIGYQMIINNSPEVIEACAKLGDTLLFKPHDNL